MGRLMLSSDGESPMATIQFTLVCACVNRWFTDNNSNAAHDFATLSAEPWYIHGKKETQEKKKATHLVVVFSLCNSEST